MVQIKVTPERLEQSAKIVREAKNRLEQIHKDLYQQTEYIASMWSGATSQRFYQMFNETKPQMFNVFREFDKIAEELMNAAEKFRNADELYGGNLVDGSLSNEDIEEGAMCGKLIPKSDLEKAWDGLYTGAGQAVGDAWEGFKALGDGETWSNMWDAVVNYDETFPAMWNVFSDSFMNDVWYGDVESGFRWGSYLLTSIGTGLLGGKGLDKVSKLARGVNVYKVTEAFPPRLQPAFADGLTSGTMTSMLPPTGNWGNYLSGYLMFARPSWRQSELDAGDTFSKPKYTDQISFKDREKVSYGTKGSTRPDFFSYEEGRSIEIKNYNVTTSSGRNSLINIVIKQFEDRIKHLPEGVKQTVLIDVRGQTVTKETLKQIKEEITQRTFGQIEIIIKKDSN
ncbi:WXG100 family type VII secretion target [Bacillus paranthracis]|uniref:WXG100 family type VII secretion target n=1 Tax=Bacillus paranthracis TaxID=2026186 RepID=UPI003D25F2CC